MNAALRAEERGNRSALRAEDKSRGKRNWRGGFTLLELLVVISIILLVVAAILPAFGRLIESQNYSSAINTVTVTLGQARALSIKNGRRTGVVFLWDAKTERFSLQVVELLAREGASLSKSAVAPCESFRPARNTTPIELPKRTAVYGLASGSLFHPGDTRNLNPMEPEKWWWYAGEVMMGSSEPIIPWIFPRNDPRLFTDSLNKGPIGQDAWGAIRGDAGVTIDAAQALVALRNCCTFFVQFSEDGKLLGSRRSGGADYHDAYLEYPALPVDQSTPRAQPYDDAFRFDPEVTRGANSEPNPEVMLRVAEQFAIVDLGRLQEGTGYERPWLVRPTDSKARRSDIMNDGQYCEDEKARNISRWIDLNSEVISFNRFTGAVIRRSAP